LINTDTYTLVDNQNSELAFKLYKFESLRHFDHIQRLNYYSIIWIQSGSGTAQIETEKYTYAGDHIFACSPYQPFMFDANTDTRGFVINFHPNFFCIHKHHSEIACDGVFFNNVYQYPYITISDAECETLSWIVSEMKKDIEENSLAISEAILSYLKLFLINCSRIKKRNYPEIPVKQEDAPEKFIVQQLKNYIENNFRSLHSTKDYAALLHMTPNALTKLVKATSNKTPSALIAERIIIEAKRELYLSDKSVEEIALELGYDDPFYFSRFFKKQTNISPSIYRKTVVYNKAAGLQ